MRTIVIMAICALILSVGVMERRTQAITYSTDNSPQIVRVASVAEETDGIQTWTRIVALGGLEDIDRPARTLFVPSDAAFQMLPEAELAALLTPSRRDVRRAFLARAASETRIGPEQVSGRSISLVTLDGRPLTIDATGGELMVGDAEALDVRTLADGRVIYVLDRPLPVDRAAPAMAN